MPFLKRQNKRFFHFPQHLINEWDKNATDILGLQDFVKNNR